MDNFSGTSEVLYMGLLLSIGLNVSYEEFGRLPRGTKQQITTRILALVNDPGCRLEHSVKEGALKMAEMFITEGPTMNTEETNALFNGGGDGYGINSDPELFRTECRFCKCRIVGVRSRAGNETFCPDCRALN
jgi:hypothetical protein